MKKYKINYMISKEKAIQIALSQMPSKGYKVDLVKYIKSENIWVIATSKNGKGFQVELDANTGKVVGGAGGAP